MSVLDDITRNLLSLQFETALTDDEKSLLYLRTRSLAVLSSACAQAAYFVAILNKGKKNLFENVKPSSTYHPIKVGIIGCGRLGKQIATVLLEFGHVNASDLSISTRCPENLEEFESKGVLCCFDNKMVSRKVDVLFLCCLPSQLHTVSKELRGNLNCVVYSLIGGMALAKISQLLDYQQIIQPSFTFSSHIHEKAESNPWRFDRTLIESLRDPVCSMATCPLKPSNDSVLFEDGKLCQLFVFVFLNQCTTFGVDRYEAMRLCNLVMFGLEENQSSCLEIRDVLPDDVESTNTCGNERVFPIFDLVKLTLDETPLGKKLSLEDNLRQAFLMKYREVFGNTFVENTN